MKIFCVISHTHWDREWYMPLEHFRLKLCDLLDHCLTIMDKQPEYMFHLDGQTIMLEDYLAVRPSKAAILSISKTIFTLRQASQPSATL